MFFVIQLYFIWKKCRNQIKIKSKLFRCKCLSRYIYLHLGDIEIKLPEECVSHIDLTGKQVDMDSALVFLTTQPSDHQKMIGKFCLFFFLLEC